MARLGPPRPPVRRCQGPRSVRRGFAPAIPARAVAPRATPPRRDPDVVGRRGRSRAVHDAARSRRVRGDPARRLRQAPALVDLRPARPAARRTRGGARSRARPPRRQAVQPAARAHGDGSAPPPALRLRHRNRRPPGPAHADRAGGRHPRLPGPRAARRGAAGPPPGPVRRRARRRGDDRRLPAATGDPTPGQPTHRLPGPAVGGHPEPVRARPVRATTRRRDGPRSAPDRGADLGRGARRRGLRPPAPAAGRLDHGRPGRAAHCRAGSRRTGPAPSPARPAPTRPARMARPAAPCGQRSCSPSPVPRCSSPRSCC